MSKSKDVLGNFKGFTRPKDIQLRDDSIIKSYGSGNIRLGKITLNNVLHAPKLSLGLISVNTIAREVNGRVCLGITHGIIKNHSGNPIAAATFEKQISPISFLRLLLLLALLLPLPLQLPLALPPSDFEQTPKQTPK